MAADVAATVRNCAPCARDGVNFRRHTNHLKLFLVEEPLRGIIIEILGPVQRTERGNSFSFVITDRFSELTAVLKLRTTNAYSEAIALARHGSSNTGRPSQF